MLSSSTYPSPLSTSSSTGVVTGNCSSSSNNGVVYEAQHVGNFKRNSVNKENSDEFRDVKGAIASPSPSASDSAGDDDPAADAGAPDVGDEPPDEEEGGEADLSVNKNWLISGLLEIYLMTNMTPLMSHLLFDGGNSGVKNDVVDVGSRADDEDSKYEGDSKRRKVFSTSPTTGGSPSPPSASASASDDNNSNSGNDGRDRKNCGAPLSPRKNVVSKGDAEISGDHEKGLAAAAFKNDSGTHTARGSSSLDDNLSKRCLFKRQGDDYEDEIREINDTAATTMSISDDATSPARRQDSPAAVESIRLARGVAAMNFALQEPEVMLEKHWNGKKWGDHVTRKEFVNVTKNLCNLPSFMSDILFRAAQSPSSSASPSSNLSYADWCSYYKSSVHGIDSYNLLFNLLAANSAQRNEDLLHSLDGNTKLSTTGDISFSSDNESFNNSATALSPLPSSLKSKLDSSSSLAAANKVTPPSSASSVSSQPYITRDNLLPFMSSLLTYHPGLSFLSSHAEFQEKYAITVITRIFYKADPTHEGRLTLRMIKKACLLETMMMLDETDDINKVTEFFSYEHFYVLYCRFWELDVDRDYRITKDDLKKYSDSSLSDMIIDRIFESGPRPFGNANTSSDYLSYEDFIYFMLSEEDKQSESAIRYWFQCLDGGCNGRLTKQDIKPFYDFQKDRMRDMGHDIVEFHDVLCQFFDMVSKQEETCIPNTAQ